MGRSGCRSLLREHGQKALISLAFGCQGRPDSNSTMPRSYFPSAQTLESLEQQTTQLSRPLSSQCRSLLLQASVFLFTKVPWIGRPLGLSTVPTRDPPLGD